NVDVSFQPTLPHRLSVASTSSASRFNAVVDFVPADLPALLPNLVNQVATNESCGSCHGSSADRSSLAFPNLHGNTPLDVNFCVTCHTLNVFDGYLSRVEAWVDMDRVNIVHKLHGASCASFAPSRDYGQVPYPKPSSNCLTCDDHSRMP